eukprot:Protomagalhaensia_sp_Gyna_25__5230@NODE_635_length_2954_cov_9_184220_g494_i0_p1_GENE_NODE_635_length_2954_cov_9_184220_g494_i0NODE_635_length_2954_cov_9_184220_g494_i0_p1_ORF_typecomplete_len978_score130_94WD40/PF00400_32/0_0036WD40/PF00400_32/0_00024WD40/PF00400_32/8_4e02WD40/PF00400_32/0_0017WD40/PF00400_32/2_4e02WD40/PF00400_32/6e02ANAPC4_WD40/PF12894_7/0_22ANAPC4_WD40/PF12894_7/5_1ANAPC4_WD40/PF12894_7/1_1e06ANAPC4_WD40/PF12894_7/0_68ANAPC4_WD40/PF12894_7/1_5e03ANAPC4_WD40/PF12894_7/8_7e03eI
MSQSQGMSQSRRMRSLFPEEPFSDGAAATESMQASEGRAGSNALSSPPDGFSEPSGNSQFLEPSPLERSPTCVIQPLQRVLSSPVSAVAQVQVRSNGSSPLAPLNSAAVCVSDSPLPISTTVKESPGENALTWPFDEEDLDLKEANLIGTHTRSAAYDMDELEFIDEAETSRFMHDGGELGSTDDSHNAAPGYDYPMLLARHRLEPLRMETVIEEEVSSLVDQSRSSTFSSSTSNCSAEQDRIKFEDMLGLRAEKIRTETAEKQSALMTRPTSESQQTDRVQDERSSRWAVPFKGRFTRKATTQSIPRKGTGETEAPASRKSRRGSGHLILDKIMKRGSRRNHVRHSSRRVIFDERSLTSNLHLFPKYLTLNPHGWVRVPVKPRLDNYDKVASPPAKGFEAVWLVDKDDIAVGIKEWLNAAPACTLVHEPASPAASPATAAAKPSRKGRGTQTPLPPPGMEISGGPLWCLAMTKDEKYLAAGSRQGLIYVWESGSTHLGLEEGLPIERPRPLRRCGGFAGHTGGVISIQWSGNPRSYVMVSCAVDKTVRIWTLGCDTTLAILRCTSIPVGISFTKKACDDQIVVAGLDGSVKLVNLTPAPSTFKDQDPNESPPLVNCEAIASYNFPEAITCLAISPDGHYLACGMQFGTVMVQNLEHGTPERQLEYRNRKGKHSKGGKITGVDWAQSAAGYYLCVTGRDSRIRVVAVQDDDRQLKLKGSDIRLKAFFDPSNRFVIGVSEVNRISIWDMLEAGTGNPLRTRKSQFRLRRTERVTHRAATIEDFDSSNGVVPAAVHGIQSHWIPSLSADPKKPTALPVSSFKAVQEQGVTALLVTSTQQDNDSEDSTVRIFCGTSTGSIHVFIAVITPFGSSR